MILTDREIKNSLTSGLLDISPRPAPDAYSSTTVDLTLDQRVRIFKRSAPGLSIAIDPTMEDYRVQELIKEVTDPHDISKDDGYDLKPGILILGWTREKIELRLHGRVAARVEGKSGLARVGLAIHCTAPVIHSGFKGTVQLEIVNHGPMAIKLRPGLAICQLVFEQTLGMPDSAYEGQFLGQQAT